MKDVSVTIDNNTNLGNEGGKQERFNSLQSSLKSAREARLASAEAVAAALTQAATAAATGELDGNEAGMIHLQNCSSFCAFLSIFLTFAFNSHTNVSANTLAKIMYCSFGELLVAAFGPA
jgi:hypothetical protein